MPAANDWGDGLQNLLLILDYLLWQELALHRAIETRLALPGRRKQ